MPSESHDMAAQLIALVEPWAGSRDEAVAWFHDQPLPSFGNLRPADLVRRGRADAVKAYITRIAAGGYS
ncbi:MULTISPECIES: MbcA/ParS/Xre antitoxin family protein [Salipiger]|uniref:MbcA/ParS/Xre antitoxin family protein n=2 Tax=Roseobacteraceae TaxID=2854170 RepID=UPI0035128A6F